MCGYEGPMREYREDIPWKALPGTVIANVEHEECPQCGESYEVFSRFEELFHVLAVAVIEQPSRLGGDEIRFLRNFLELAQVELAMRLGVTQETISRWETGKQQISKTADHLLRLMVAYELQLEGYLDRIASVAVEKPRRWTFRVEREDEGWVPRPAA
jgi:putative zinc finger/helix-turn-helix YgiT family protein